MFAGQLARAIVALFTGAAVYISSPLVEWNLAYRRGYMMQASLAIAGGFFGVVAFSATFEWHWLLEASCW